jgi:hypothetical protein
MKLIMILLLITVKVWLEAHTGASKKEPVFKHKIFRKIRCFFV